MGNSSPLASRNSFKAFVSLFKAAKRPVFLGKFPVSLTQSDDLVFCPSFPFASLPKNYKHTLLAQHGKYGTVTATVLPDWTGTLMRWLIALIRSQSDALF